MTRGSVSFAEVAATQGASGVVDAPETPPRLGHDQLRAAVEELAERDEHLAAVRERFGVPPLWARRPGFSALVRIILEQQVSLASARAAFGRLRAAVDRLTPRSFLELDAATLRRAGFSRHLCLPPGSAGGIEKPRIGP